MTYTWQQQAKAWSAHIFTATGAVWGIFSAFAIMERQWQQKRLAHAAMDLVAQIATLSRVTALMNDQGAEASGTEAYIADTFCTRAHNRVERNLDQVEHNDDERMHAIARASAVSSSRAMPRSMAFSHACANPSAPPRARSV